MGHKVFISFKYGDTTVMQFPTGTGEATRVRDYVTLFQEKLKETDHLNKGEMDGESLADYKDSTIESKLRDRIYNSTITVVFIFPRMKDPYLPEDDQWIPLEVAYSLREPTRNGRKSIRNAVLAVVIPAINASFYYAIQSRFCCQEKCETWHPDSLFKILRLNMFNRKTPDMVTCHHRESVYRGEESYIHMFRWNYFIEYIDECIAIAEKNCDKGEEYIVRVEV